MMESIRSHLCLHDLLKPATWVLSEVNLFQVKFWPSDANVKEFRLLQAQVDERPVLTESDSF
jgi:hypothetical protein